jgi:hypothetical protein
VNPVTARHEPSIRLVNDITWREHRSGWSFALEALRPFHSEDGIALDGFLDATFSYIPGKSPAWPPSPYTSAWVGFLHNPVGIPEWHEFHSSPLNYCRTPVFQESLAHCRGIFCLCESLRDWLRVRLPVTVDSLWHPTEEPLVRFSLDRWRAARPRPLVQVGWWLRKMGSIFRLQAPGYCKSVLMPVFPDREEAFESVLERELRATGREGVDRGSVSKIPHQDPAAYDELLSRSVVFLDFHDCAASNAVIECSVRHTPMLVNRLPAVEEYLGRDYPLFFENLAQAEELLDDPERIEAAHRYLAGLPEQRFSAERFRQRFAASEIWRTSAPPARGPPERTSS